MTNHTLTRFRGVKQNVVIKCRLAGPGTPDAHEDAARQSSYPPITPVRISSSICASLIPSTSRSMALVCCPSIGGA
ncbi:MAG: hypothetical protein QOJ04_2508 [Caballeronia sp.]|jgi:hypothetical protein|nr:hypothetical protein [Caballeronia sp.]